MTTVIHDADKQKDSMELKRQRREAALQRKLAAAEKKIIEQGLGAFGGYQQERFEKLLGEERCLELDARHQGGKAVQQMSLFEGGTGDGTV